MRWLIHKCSRLRVTVLDDARESTGCSPKRDTPEGNRQRNQEVEATDLMHDVIRDLLFAIIAAVPVAAAAWLWRRTQPWQRVKRSWAWLWDTLHKRQIEEITELRKDVDALLSVLDHWITPGAGDKQRQFEYMAEVLEARGKRGISGAYTRVASLIDNQNY